MHTVYCVVNGGIGDDAFVKATEFPQIQAALRAANAIWEHQNTLNRKNISVWITNRKGCIIYRNETLDGQKTPAFGLAASNQP